MYKHWQLKEQSGTLQIMMAVAIKEQIARNMMTWLDNSLVFKAILNLITIKFLNYPLLSNYTKSPNFA